MKGVSDTTVTCYANTSLFIVMIIVIAYERKLEDTYDLLTKKSDWVDYFLYCLIGFLTMSQ